MATDLSQTVSLEEITGIAPQLYTEPLDPRRTALIIVDMQVRYTVFAGQFTEGCLGLTALDACDHGFAVTLADDACYGASRAGHLVMLRMFDQHWGRVRTVAELTRELRGKP